MAQVTEVKNYALKRARRYKNVLFKVHDLAQQYLILVPDGEAKVGELLIKLADNGYDTVVPTSAPNHLKLQDCVIVRFPYCDGVKEKAHITSMLKKIMHIVRLGHGNYTDYLFLAVHPKDVQFIVNEVKSCKLQHDVLSVVQSGIGTGVLVY